MGHAGSQPLGSEGTGPFRRQFRSSSSETTTWTGSNASGKGIPSVLSFDAKRVSDRYSDSVQKIYPAGINVQFIIKY